MTGSHSRRVSIGCGTGVCAGGNCRNYSNCLEANGTACCNGMNGHTRTRRCGRGVLSSCCFFGCCFLGSILIRTNELTIPNNNGLTEKERHERESEISSHTGTDVDDLDVVACTVGVTVTVFCTVLVMGS